MNQKAKKIIGVFLVLLVVVLSEYYLLLSFNGNVWSDISNADDGLSRFISRLKRFDSKELAEYVEHNEFDKITKSLVRFSNKNYVIQLLDICANSSPTPLGKEMAKIVIASNDETVFQYYQLLVNERLNQSTFDRLVVYAPSVYDRKDKSLVPALMGKIHKNSLGFSSGVLLRNFPEFYCRNYVDKNVKYLHEFITELEKVEVKHE